MGKNFYFFGIFTLALGLGAGVFQSIIHLTLDSQIYFLQPFANWFLVLNIISLIGTLFFLKYLHYKKFSVAFWTGVIVTVFTFCKFILVYIRLILAARELDSYSIVTAIPSLVAGALFGLTLSLSRSRVRPWLKAAGIFTFLVYMAVGTALVWGIMVSHDVLLTGVEKVQQWAGLASNAIFVCLIMNFRSELSKVPAEVENNVGVLKYKEVLSGLLIAVASFGLILGVQLANESYWTLHWQRKRSEKIKELTKPFEARSYVNARGDSLRYLLLKPLEYDAQKRYPLVICLHGGPVRARQVELPEPAALLSIDSSRKKYPAFVFVPQSPPGHCWGGLPEFPSVDSLVFETIQTLEEEFEIDQTRRYVAGGSMGGYGAWYFIGTRPEMFAAAIPYCGAGNPDLAKNMVKVPVWAFHGTVDRNVSVRGSRRIVEAIKDAGGNPRYTEFAGVGHNVWPSVMQTPGVLDWMFEQKR